MKSHAFQTEILIAELMFSLKFFEMPCEQRYIVDQNENLLFKTYTEKDLYKCFKVRFNILTKFKVENRNKGGKFENVNR